MVQEEKGQGFLSQDWGGKAGIGMCSLDTKTNHAWRLFEPLGFPCALRFIMALTIL